MKASSFEKAQKLTYDMKACAFQMATFIRTAQNALEAGEYERAAICLENAATWCLSMKKAAGGGK